MALSFLPAKQNFPFWKGSTFRYAFKWVIDTGTEKKASDLTGFTGKATIVGDDGSEITLTTGNGGVIFGDKTLKEPKNGLIELYMTATATGAVTWTSRAKYTLYVTEPNPPNDEVPLLSGLFVIAGPPL